MENAGGIDYLKVNITDDQAICAVLSTLISTLDVESNSLYFLRAFSEIFTQLPSGRDSTVHTMDDRSQRY
jgi:hypothetical protein